MYSSEKKTKKTPMCMYIFSRCERMGQMWILKKVWWTNVPAFLLRCWFQTSTTAMDTIPAALPSSRSRLCSNLPLAQSLTFCTLCAKGTSRILQRWHQTLSNDMTLCDTFSWGSRPGDLFGSAFAAAPALCCRARQPQCC